MFSSLSPVGHEVIISDMQVLTDEFLQGKPLSLELSDHVFGNIARTRGGTYTEYVDKVKQILGYSKIDYHYDLMIIKSSAQLADDEKAVLVRFINLCATHRRKIVVFNGNVIYVPEDLKKFGNEVLTIHVNSAFRDYRNKRKIKAFARKFSLKKLILFLH